MQNTDPRQLAGFLRDENPQTIALVLSNLTPEAGGALLQSLPSELQPQVALRMATLDRVSPEVFRKITEAIGSKLKAIRQVSRSDGIRSLAGLLNHVDPALADTILTQVEEENQGAANSVRNLMFTFEDILNIDKEGMKALVGAARPQGPDHRPQRRGAEDPRRISRSACRRAPPRCSSKTWRRSGPVRIRDVQAAQQQVVAVVRQLQQQGEHRDQPRRRRRICCLKS